MNENEPYVWELDGLCRQVDPELFFPEKGDNAKAARRVCANCPVRTECLEAGVTEEHEFGIWGGLSINELKTLRKQRRWAA